jgi:hypothetical protein
MCALGHPLYHKMRVYNKRDVENLPTYEFFRNFFAMEVQFTHPGKDVESVKRVKYPGISQNVDDTTTIFPMSGKSIITGYEYIQARNSGCEFSKILAIAIPYDLKEEDKESKNNRINRFDVELAEENTEIVSDYYDKAPFTEIEGIIQSERRKYPKNTFENLF